MQLRLPFFLEPLRLIPYYKQRLGDSLDRWRKGEDQRVFGPLEQVVVAMVVIGIAMQSPPTFTSGERAPAPPGSSSQSPNPQTRNSDSPRASMETNPAAIRGWTESYSAAQQIMNDMDITHAAILLLGVNVILIFLPEQIKHNLKASWSLFWPPWQDRSASGTSTRFQAAMADHNPTECKATPSGRSEIGPELHIEASRRKDPVGKREGDGVRPAVTANVPEEQVREKDPTSEAVVGTKDGSSSQSVIIPPAAASAAEVKAPITPELKIGEKEVTSSVRTQRKEEQAREKRREDRKAGGTGDSTAKEEAAKGRAEVVAVAEALGSAASPRLKPSSAHHSNSASDIGTKQAALPGSQAEAKSKGITDPEQLREMQKQLVRYRQREEEAKEAIQAEKAQGVRADPVEMQVLRVNYEKARTKRKELEVALAGTMADLKNHTSEPEAKSADAKLNSGSAAPASSESRAMGERKNKQPPPEERDRNLTQEETKVRAGKGSSTPPPTSNPASSSREPSSKPSSSRSSSTIPSPEKTMEPIAPSSVPSHAPASDADPLMAGDYRPLKSALKKSKKKPRQSKNIHHNYFMTMRGHRPAMVPFPHGLHPPPTALRHTLWWDNIPKDADHIMASPAILKVPDNGPDEEDELVPKAGKTRDKLEEPSLDGRKDDKVAETEKAAAVAPAREKQAAKDANVGAKQQESRKVVDTGAKGSTEAGKGEVTDASNAGTVKRTEIDPEADKAKVRAAAQREKEIAKAKAGAGSLHPPNMTASPSEPLAIQEAGMDPQMRKATLTSQALLCAVLYVVHRELAIALFIYFTWQYFESRKNTQLPPSALSVTTPVSAAERTAAAKSDSSRPNGRVGPASTSPKDQPGVAERASNLKTQSSASNITRSARRRSQEEANPSADISTEKDEETRRALESLKSLKRQQAQLEAEGRFTDELKVKLKAKRSALEKQLTATYQATPVPVPVATGTSKGKEKMSEEMVKNHEAKTARPSSQVSDPNEIHKAMRKVYERLKALKKDEDEYKAEGILTDELKAKFERKRLEVEKALAELKTKEKKSKLGREEMTPERVDEMQKARKARRRERERAEKEKVGQGSSGLSPLEKEAL